MLINQSTGLTLTIHNTAGSPTPTLAGLGFTDKLPSGLTFANSTVSTSNCGASPTATITLPDTLTFSGGSVAGTDCTISSTVTGSSAGNYTNSYANSNVYGAAGGLNINGAAATLPVLAPPGVAVSFGSNPMIVAGS